MEVGGLRPRPDLLAKAKRQTKNRSVAEPMNDKPKSWLEKARDEANGESEFVMGDPVYIRRPLWM